MATALDELPVETTIVESRTEDHSIPNAVVLDEFEMLLEEAGRVTKFRASDSEPQPACGSGGFGKIETGTKGRIG